MQISVGVRDAEGKVKSMGKKTFRVKNLPDANGTILGFSEGVRSGSFIKNNTINAEFKDFDFELDLKVLSFEIEDGWILHRQFRPNVSVNPLYGSISVSNSPLCHEIVNVT